MDEEDLEPLYRIGKFEVVMLGVAFVVALIQALWGFATPGGPPGSIDAVYHLALLCLWVGLVPFIALGGRALLWQVLPPETPSGDLARRMTNAVTYTLMLGAILVVSLFLGVQLYIVEASILYELSFVRFMYHLFVIGFQVLALFGVVVGVVTGIAVYRSGGFKTNEQVS